MLLARRALVCHPLPPRKLVCDRPAVTLPQDLPLADIPNIDSLRLLQAIALLEEAFSVEINVVALERLDRVRDIVDIISDALPE